MILIFFKEACATAGDAASTSAGATKAAETKAKIRILDAIDVIEASLIVSREDIGRFSNINTYIRNLFRNCKNLAYSKMLAIVPNNRFLTGSFDQLAMTNLATTPAGEGPARESHTLATTTQNRLRADILNCTLKPGQTLRFDWLRETYKISLSPLREALMRLIAEGLVQLEDHRGFRVAPVSIDHLLDLTMVRRETEALAIRLAIEKGDDHWESFILASFNTLSKYPSKDGRQLFDQEWEKRHRAFHYSLYAACGSPILLGSIAHYDNQWSRYRLLSGRYMNHRRNIQQEHAALKEAVVARNPVKATEAIQQHISASTDSILAANEPIFENS